jgi:hypothetical protein
MINVIEDKGEYTLTNIKLIKKLNAAMQKIPEDLEKSDQRWMWLGYNMWQTSGF